MLAEYSQFIAKLYEHTNLRARWLMIGLVAVVFIVPQTNSTQIASLVMLAAVYNAANYLPIVKRRRTAKVRWLPIAVNFVFIATLIVISGGLTSPYQPLILMVIVAAAYWYGYTGLAFSGSATVMLWSTMLILRPSYSLSYLVFGMFTFILGDCAVALGQLTRQAQKRLEENSTAVNEQRKRLFSLVNGLSQAIFVIDKEGRIVVYNGAALELLDTHYEIEGLNVAEVVKLCDDKGKPTKPIQAAIASGDLFTSSDLTLKAGKDKMLQVYVSVSPMVEEGERVGVLLLLRDITDQKTLDNQKDEFISIISHELRTPVAIVEADLSTLMLPKFVQLPDHAAKLLTNAYQNLTFLANLLKDLSNLASSERSVLDTEISQVNVADLCQRLADGLKDKAKEQKLKLTLKAGSGVPTITTSAQRVEEILVNLLTNAIKYSTPKSGSVEMVVSKSKLFAGGVRVDVVDHGLGMAKSDQAKLFTKFFRSENPQAQAVKGTGMGLYVCKKQADKIGAKITLTSQLGKGSTFSIDLPKRNKASSTEVAKA